MSTYVVRTRLRRRDIKHLIAQIPGMLSGKVPDNKGVGRVFAAHLMRGVIQRISAAYDAKSHGGPDDNGDTWEPIKESTIKAKMRDPTTGTYWPVDPRQIGFHTGLQRSAFEAGEVSGGVYHATSNQRVIIRQGSFEIRITVKHYRFFRTKRPVIPRGGIPSKWLIPAAAEAANAAISHAVGTLA